MGRVSKHDGKNFTAHELNDAKLTASNCCRSLAMIRSVVTLVAHMYRKLVHNYLECGRRRMPFTSTRKSSFQRFLFVAHFLTFCSFSHVGEVRLTGS
jgi:hypothetical protein